jgi:hypothetical protein
MSLLLLSSLGGAFTADAQLTGSSFVDFVMEPIPCTLVGEIKLDTPCEKTLLKFDIESIIKLSASVSGMVFSIDSAIGIPGLEHLILRGLFTLGSVDLTSELWLATPFETVTDVNLMPNTVVIPPGRFLFVKQRLTTVITLGGLTAKNLAIFEDVTFPNPGAYYGEIDCDGDGSPEGTCILGIETNPANQYQTQSFAFGNLFSLTGQTPSGITVSSQLGICATNAGKAVKKFSAPGGVNPECATRVKPSLLFDLMTISISSIPLTAGVSASVNMSCIQITACKLTNTFALSGGPIPFSTSLTFTDLFKVSFGGVRFRVPAGPVTISVGIDSGFSLASASFSFAKAISAGDLSARLTSSGSFVKGRGLTGVAIGLSVTSGTFSANHALQLVRNPDTDSLEFGSFGLTMGLTLAPARASLQVVFGQAGLSRAGFRIGLVF